MNQNKNYFFYCFKKYCCFRIRANFTDKDLGTVDLVDIILSDFTRPVKYICGRNCDPTTATPYTHDKQEQLINDD